MSIGEFIVDIVPEAGARMRAGSWPLRANAGGAPANVAVAIARLGGRSGFCGMVSEDSFGRRFVKLLETEGVDGRFVRRSPRPTPLALVHLDERGERSFSFYRGNTADVALRPEDIPHEALLGARAIHVCSISLSQEPARRATLSAVERAAAQGRFVSFDVNWRPRLWPDAAEAFELVHQVMDRARFVKMSGEEFAWLFPGKEPSILLERRATGVEPTLWIVTRGHRPAIVVYDGAVLEMKARTVRAVDTTGAGDAFTGAMLARLATSDFVIPSEEALRDAVDFAHAAAALCVTRYGGIPALARLEEVERFRAERRPAADMG